MKSSNLGFSLRLAAAFFAIAALLAAPVLAAPIINEFVANHTGTDTGEYIEIYGDPNTDYSAYTVFEVEGEGPNRGLIDTVIVPVGTTDANGFWTHFVGGTGLLENGTMSLLLVTGFTGAENNDIDTNDDGTIDTTFWTSIVDAIGVRDNDVTEFTYGGTQLAHNFDGGGFTVGGASRIPNGTDTDSVGDWVRNAFDNTNATVAPGEAYNTPNAANFIPEPGGIVLAMIAVLSLTSLRRRTGA
jgi:hypothetical protein